MLFPFNSKEDLNNCKSELNNCKTVLNETKIKMLQPLIMSHQSLEETLDLNNEQNKYILNIHRSNLYDICNDISPGMDDVTKQRLRTQFTSRGIENTNTYKVVFAGLNNTLYINIVFNQRGGSCASSWRSTNKTVIIDGRPAKVYVNKTTGSRAVKKYKVDKRGVRTATYKAIK